MEGRARILWRRQLTLLDQLRHDKTLFLLTYFRKIKTRNYKKNTNTSGKHEMSSNLLVKRMPEAFAMERVQNHQTSKGRTSQHKCRGCPYTCATQNMQCQRPFFLQWLAYLCHVYKVIVISWSSNQVSKDNIRVVRHDCLQRKRRWYTIISQGINKDWTAVDN